MGSSGASSRPSKNQTALPQQSGATGSIPPPPPYPQFYHRGRNVSGAALSDRPDSGFDSNRDEGAASSSAVVVAPPLASAESAASVLAEEREEGQSASPASSPEAAEISRRAPIRQPVFRKKRTHF